MGGAERQLGAGPLASPRGHCIGLDFALSLPFLSFPISLHKDLRAVKGQRRVARLIFCSLSEVFYVEFDPFNLLLNFVLAVIEAPWPVSGSRISVE